MSAKIVSRELTVLHAYEEYFDELLSYGIKILSDKERVADCIHDLFIELYQKKNIDTINQLKPYLFRCLRNVLIDEFKKSKLASFNHLENYPFEISSQEELLIKDEIDANKRKKLKQAFSELSPRQKEVIYLRFRDNLTYEQIADVTGISNQSVRNHFSLAIKHLREFMSSTLLMSLFATIQ